MVLYLFKAAPVFLGGDDLAVIFLAYRLGELLGVAYLVVLFIAAEADGKGLVNVCDSCDIA